MSDAGLFRRDAERWHPDARTVGPWDPGALHGGAPAALLAHVLDRTEPGLPIARLTIELVRPVPLDALTVDARVTRGGRRVQLVEAEITAGATLVVRARALRIRRADGVAPAVEQATPPLPPPEDGGPWEAVEIISRPNFGADGMEVVQVRAPEGGRAAAWFRMRLPTVAGTNPSPLERAAAAADFGNGISAPLDWARYVFINPDLTIYVDRDPEGEWIGLDSTTVVGPAGTGRTDSVLHDRHGPFGRAAQALYVDQRT